MTYAQGFWPLKEGDKACPKCGSELFITASLWTGRNPTLKLRCFDCGSEYLIDGGLVHAMKLNLRELPRQDFRG